MVLLCGTSTSSLALAVMEDRKFMMPRPLFGVVNWFCIKFPDCEKEERSDDTLHPRDS